MSRSPYQGTSCSCTPRRFPLRGRLTDPFPPSSQCDEGKPTCKQCAKSKRECAGYRNEFEIVHRDQTKSTVRRMTKALSKSRSTTTSTLPSPRPSPTRQQTPDPIATLTVPLAQRAICYFASNFLYVPLGHMPHGHMDYLVPLIDCAPPDSALRSAFNACAIAALGNREKTNNVNLTNLSLREHTVALAKTHAALGNPATASSDATLATVLLLGLYEVRLPTPTFSICVAHPLTVGLNRVSRRSRSRACWHGVRTLTEQFRLSSCEAENKCAAPKPERSCSKQ